MRTPPRLLGLRHLALRVRDLARAKDFYVKLFGMKVIWEPDSQNCYLSSGMDNLALHEVIAPGGSQKESHFEALDHFGFVAGSPEVVDAWAQWALERGIRV